MNFIPPNEEERRLVLNELKTNEDELEKETIELKKWLCAQRHLPQEIENNLLKTFALFNKKGIEESKRRLDAFFSIRSMLPTIYAERDPKNEKLLASSNNLAIGICPGYTEDKCRVYVGKLINDDSKVFDFDSMAKRMMIIHDYGLSFDFKSGMYLLSDCKGLSVQHLLKVSLTLTRYVLFSIQNVYPIRIRKIIFINVNSYCKPLLNTMILPFLKKKLAARTHILTDDLQELGTLLPLEIVPSDMGGSGLSTVEINDFWSRRILSEREWILTDGMMHSDETKREGKNPIDLPGCSIM